MVINFFQTANVQIALQAVIDSLQSRPIDDSKAQLLRDILGIIKANGAAFDEKCATNISWIGSQFEGNAQLLAKTPSDDKALDLFIAFVYRFIVEWTSHATIDKLEPQIEARSNASGLTPPKWLWRLVRL